LESRDVLRLNKPPQGVACRMLSRLASNAAISSPGNSPQMTPDMNIIHFIDCSEAPMRFVVEP